ncbi:MAG: transketolase [Armatimonadetes bacterium]|nr:transketolase [Armatimonadota bacterium]
MKASDIETLTINVIRALCMDGPQQANAGHPGTGMACAPIGWTLYGRIMKHNPRNPHWPDRDRFILSAGHACILQYSLLHLTGYELPLEELRNFRQWGSMTPGHPEVHHTPGVETTTGPLGQGISNAVGMALAERFLGAHFNRPGHEIVDHYTYALVSDGDAMEGVSNEACSLAGHLRLGKLIVFYDDNHITIEGETRLAFSENVDDRYRALGWHVQRLDSPNETEALEKAVEAARRDPRPSLISVRTHIAYPAPQAQDTAEAHGAPLGEEEVRRTKEILGLPPDKSFCIPDEVYDFAHRCIERGRKAEEEWTERFAAYQREHPELARDWQRCQKGELPEGWDRDLPEFEPGKGTATRNSSGKVLNALAPRIPNLIGGSADLAPSTKTLMSCTEAQSAENHAGRNLHFGVREHAMAAMLNGMALHGGVIPFGATFFIFSDYMRPAIRLACIMGAPLIYVWTHDSVGLGEDGPTHQAIEQLPALRAIPNMTLIRPCDANEVREAWKAALLHRTGPVGLVLTRQDVPTLDRGQLGPAQGLHRGAYVLAEAQGGPARVLLIASGSEVHTALAARDILQREGVPTRVVSMPSWELFQAQDAAYQDEVLPPGVIARVAVEAASPFGWERWVGRSGRVVGMRRFGASAPWKTNMQKFGFTGDNVAAAARELLD